MYRINAGGAATIDRHGTCRIVTNASANDIMIPAKTNSEWQSFLSATIASVSKASCGTCECPNGSLIAFGGLCESGGVCGGSFNGSKYMLAPGNCSNSSSPTCDNTADTLTKTWRGSTGTNADIASLENVLLGITPSTVLGDVNTTTIVASGSISADSAAHYCDNMDFAGHTDWYLPSKTELAYMMCNSGATPSIVSPQEKPNCGGAYGLSSAFAGLHASDCYWNSSEGDALNAWTTAGHAQLKSLKSNSCKVRCIRKF